MKVAQGITDFRQNDAFSAHLWRVSAILVLSCCRTKVLHILDAHINILFYVGIYVVIKLHIYETLFNFAQTLDVV